MLIKKKYIQLTNNRQENECKYHQKNTYALEYNKKLINIDKRNEKLYSTRKRKSIHEEYFIYNIKIQ